MNENFKILDCKLRKRNNPIIPMVESKNENKCINIKYISSFCFFLFASYYLYFQLL